MSVPLKLGTIARSAIVAGMAISPALLVGCGQEEEEPPPQAAPAPRSAATSETLPAKRVRSEGEKIYALYCAGCHGPSGQGSPSLTEPWQNVELDGMADDLARTMALIRDYEEGSSMTAYGGMLTEAEIEAVAGYVLSLRK